MTFWVPLIGPVGLVVSPLERSRGPASSRPKLATSEDGEYGERSGLVMIYATDL